MQDQSNKYRVGCLMPLALYVVAIAIMYVITVPPEVTSNFTGRNARIFSVAIADRSDGVVQYRRVSFEAIMERDNDMPALDYALPEGKVIISEGDIHSATVIENHGDWQLIEFNYSNSYTATSIYRAFPDRVEPVSFQITSSVGQAFMAIPMIVLVYLLAWVITFARNWRVEEKTQAR